MLVKLHASVNVKSPLTWKITDPLQSRLFLPMFLRQISVVKSIQKSRIYPVTHSTDLLWVGQWLQIYAILLTLFQKG